MGRRMQHERWKSDVESVDASARRCNLRLPISSPWLGLLLPRKPVKSKESFVGFCW